MRRSRKPRGTTLVEVAMGVALFGAVLGLALSGMGMLSARSIERAERADRLSHALRLLEHLQHDLERAVATESRPATSATRCTLTLAMHAGAGESGATYRYDPDRRRLERAAGASSFHAVTARTLSAVQFDVRGLESAPDSTALVTIRIEDGTGLALETVRVVRPATEGVGPVFWNEPEVEVPSQE